MSSSKRRKTGWGCGAYLLAAAVRLTSWSGLGKPSNAYPDFLLENSINVFEIPHPTESTMEGMFNRIPALVDLDAFRGTREQLCRLVAQSAVDCLVVPLFPPAINHSSAAQTIRRQHRATTTTALTSPDQTRTLVHNMAAATPILGPSYVCLLDTMPLKN